MVWTKKLYVLPKERYFLFTFFVKNNLKLKVGTHQRGKRKREELGRVLAALNLAKAKSISDKKEKDSDKKEKDSDKKEQKVKK